MSYRIILIFVALTFPLSTFAKNSFLVAPTSVEINLSRPNTASFVVTNNGDAPVRVSISPIYFPVDSRFMPPAKPLDAKTAKQDDLSKYMIVSPGMVSVKPGDQRIIRVSVRPPAGLKKGEYRSHLLFSMLDIADRMKMKKKDDSGVSMQINFKSETAVVVYGSVGTGDFKLATECSLLKDKKNKTKVKITNSGLWRFDGWLRVYDGDNKSKPLVDDKIFMVRQSVKEETLSWSPKDNKNEVEITFVPLDDKKKSFTTKCKLV
ncbi:MAG: hypothetical protein V1647_06600 [Pseudomonadota bacterium]